MRSWTNFENKSKFCVFSPFVFSNFSGIWILSFLLWSSSSLSWCFLCDRVEFVSYWWIHAWIAKNQCSMMRILSENHWELQSIRRNSVELDMLFASILWQFVLILVFFDEKINGRLMRWWIWELVVVKFCYGGGRILLRWWWNSVTVVIGLWRRERRLLGPSLWWCVVFLEWWSFWLWLELAGLYRCHVCHWTNRKLPSGPGLRFEGNDWIWTWAFLQIWKIWRTILQNKS
jgi:hypothetical protein